MSEVRSLILLFGWMSIAILVFFLFTSCTISFQNISTHGTATDLVDENQAASPNVDTNLTLPVSAL